MVYRIDEEHASKLPIGWRRLTCPEDPQHASLASSMTTLRSLAHPSFRKCAAKAPVMPLPTTTISACLGSSFVLVKPNNLLEGSSSHGLIVGFVLGNPDVHRCSSLPFSSDSDFLGPMTAGALDFISAGLILVLYYYADRIWWACEVMS